MLGREIQVRSSSPVEDIRRVETFVNQKLAEVAIKLPNADQQLVTLLALLNVSESYLAQLDAPPDENIATDAVIARIMKKLDSTLE